MSVRLQTLTAGQSFRIPESAKTLWSPPHSYLARSLSMSGLISSSGVEDLGCVHSMQVACETCTKTGMVMVFGEITTSAKVDYEKIVRQTCKNIGFTSEDVGLDADTCKVYTMTGTNIQQGKALCTTRMVKKCWQLQVLVHIEEQSPDIGQGVHGLGTKTLEETGAGDQGHMFGYATEETEELMPLTHVLATKLGYKLTEVGHCRLWPAIA